MASPAQRITLDPHVIRLRSFWWPLSIAMVAIPLTVIPMAWDPFRVPKELEFRALGIVAIAMLARFGWRQLRSAEWRPEVSWVVLGCAWAFVSTLVSVNRSLSLRSLLTIVLSGAVFLAACLAARARGHRWLLVVLLPALVNAAIITLEALDVWRPFETGEPPIPTALLGNRNDAGAFLLGPAVAALVAAVASRGRARAAYGALAGGLLIGLVASQTVSAIAAYVAAVVVMIAVSERRGRKTTAVIILVAAVAVGLTATLAGERLRPAIARLSDKVTAAGAGSLDVASTYRLGAFLSAWKMFESRPLTGVGPGTFKFAYFDHRIEVDRDHVTMLSPQYRGGNYAEAHNDHLQILAETGLVGYLLVAGGLVVLARGIRRRAVSVARPEAAIARGMVLPLIVALAVLAVGQFPLQLAAPRLAYLFLGALCCSWSRE